MGGIKRALNKREINFMSKKHPECPLYNHDTCRDLHNPKLCAMVRKDKKCTKKNPKPRMKKKDGGNISGEKQGIGSDHDKRLIIC